MIVTKDSPEYSRLLSVAEALTSKCTNGYRFRVMDAWLDAGAGIRWTTVIADNGRSSYQTIDPSQIRKILNAKTQKEIDRVLGQIMSEGNRSEGLAHFSKRRT